MGTEMYFKMRYIICRVVIYIEPGVVHCCKLLYRGSRTIKSLQATLTAGLQHEPQPRVRPGELGGHQALPAHHLQGSSLLAHFNKSHVFKYFLNLLLGSFVCIISVTRA